MRLDQPEMNLPSGTHCADCHHFERCKALVDRQGQEDQCDWSPSRFIARQQEEK